MRIITNKGGNNFQQRNNNSLKSIIMERFMLLNANVGDVLYVRENKTVVAAKIIKYTFGSYKNSFSDASHAWLLYAGGDGTPKVQYIGCHNDKKFYRTIEDCINDANPVEKYFIDIDKVAEKCGMKATREHTQCGYGYYGVWKYKWDGFKPKRVHVMLTEFLLVNDENGWHYETIKHSREKEPTKYYDTYEECIADNKVQVVVF